MNSRVEIIARLLRAMFGIGFIFFQAACASIAVVATPTQVRSVTATMVISTSTQIPTAIPISTQTPTAMPSPIVPTLTHTPSIIEFQPTQSGLTDSNLRTRIPSPTLEPSATKPPLPNTPTPKPSSTSAPTRVFNDSNLYIHLPPQATQRQPLRVLYVLHGFGSQGETFSQGLVAEADRNSWVVVAPTMAYQDYMQVPLLMDDDLKISQMLLDTLDTLPARLNLKLDQHVLLYGFSRGAQLAHRFALLHPDRVGAVVSLSAGSYTLPLERNRDRDQTAMPFPFGVNDLEKFLGHSLDKANFNNISFWVAVGERDNLTNDVVRAFDPYLGMTRIERGRNFVNVLVSLGVDARFVVYPNTGHEITAEMRQGALKFLRDDELKDGWN